MTTKTLQGKHGGLVIVQVTCARGRHWRLGSGRTETDAVASAVQMLSKAYGEAGCEDGCLVA